MEGKPSAPRVRREIRSLTDEQFTALLVGLSTLSTVPTETGRRLWGPRYISYPEMICKHATAVADPRGDQVRRGRTAPGLGCMPEQPAGPRPRCRGGGARSSRRRAVQPNPPPSLPPRRATPPPPS